jgi:hypothetical protein
MPGAPGPEGRNFRTILSMPHMALFPGKGYRAGG